MSFRVVAHALLYSSQQFDRKFVTWNKFLCSFKNALALAFGSFRFGCRLGQSYETNFALILANLI